MWTVLKYVFQCTCIFLWICILFHLTFISALTFFLFLISTCIFTFWLVLSSIGWSICIIPIAKFVLIPWLRRRCRFWTKNVQQSRFSVGFFYPNSSTESNEERLQWLVLESILKTYENQVEIIIYTGHDSTTHSEFFDRTENVFAIDLKSYKSSITFVPVRTRHLFERKSNTFVTALKSILVASETICRFIPDIYLDFNTQVFMYPLFSTLASVPVVAYVHRPLAIGTETKPSNFSSITETSWIDQIESISRQIFLFIYGWCGQRAKLTLCNSAWTKTQIDTIYGSMSRANLVYPSCDIKSLLLRPLADHRSQHIVSIGSFQSENNQRLQIRAFHQFLQKDETRRTIFKLILMSSSRSKDDRVYIDNLKLLIDDLELNDHVQIKSRLNPLDLQAELEQATIGLHTKVNDGFAIGVVEMMAAGLIVVAHRSASSESELIKEKKTGYFGTDIDSYVVGIEQICALDAEHCQKMRKLARASVEHFNTDDFSRYFLEHFQPLTPFVQ